MNKASRIAKAMRAIAGATLALFLALTITSAAARTAWASGTPRCTTSGLAVWLGIGAGESAAGSTYYPMEFTNVSGRTCHLFGFPGVSAYNAQQVGSPAQWVQSVPKRTVTLTPGATAHTVLQIADVANFSPDECMPVTATALQVYPPNQKTATSIPFSFSACSVEGTVFMHVRPIQRGVGVPGY